MTNLHYILPFIVLSSLQLHNTEGLLFQNLKFSKFPYLFGAGRTLYNLNEVRPGQFITTNLDSIREIYVALRHLFLRQELDDFDGIFQRQIDLGKIQPQYEAQFPCNLTQPRSAITPTSVHQVRPGDIDIIATLGDSLSVGNGGISENVLQIINEFRGIAFAAGGIGTWRKFLTLPNLLKVYNPKLYGYSTAAGLSVDKSSHLNIAEPMIMSRDLALQARQLIARMRTDRNVDMQRHWKLLTIFIGNNDICSDMCHYDSREEWLQLHFRDLYKSMKILRQNVPRLLVNLVPAPNMVSTLVPMKQIPWSCSLVHRIGCHCVFNSEMSKKQLRSISRSIEMWQRIEQSIADLAEFQTEDFTVIYQPFTTNVSLPTLLNGGTDLRYFAADCFHFSQLGHASAANSLWNNMFQPIGAKQTYLTTAFKEFACPTDQNPYIVTWKNQREKV